VQIGVVIAARNAAEWIADAIGSVRAQTHRDWRLVVVDDGSEDATAEVAQSHAGADSRIAIVRQLPAGVSAARNAGAAALPSGCEALLFLDADDWLAPHALTRLAEPLASDPMAVASAGACAFVRATDRPGCWPGRVLYPVAGDLLPALLEANPFANCGQVLIRAAALRRAGLFSERLAYGEDWELLVRLALHGPFAALRASETPALFVRRRRSGAFLRQATDPSAAERCTDAIFGNPDVAARLGDAALRLARRRAAAANRWTAGRALLARGQRGRALAALGSSLVRRPSFRRAAFLLASAALPGFGAAD